MLKRLKILSFMTLLLVSFEGKGHSLLQEVSALCGVEETLLRAIILVESGIHKNRSWPWTIQVRGHSLYFKTKDGAIQYARRLLKTGIRNFDCGIAQINWRWHGHKFKSVENVFDPQANLICAARFLKSLFLRHGSWKQAAAAYHGGSPREQEIYLAKLRTKGARL